MQSSVTKWIQVSHYWIWGGGGGWEVRHMFGKRKYLRTCRLTAFGPSYVSTRHLYFIQGLPITSFYNWPVQNSRWAADGIGAGLAWHAGAMGGWVRGLIWEAASLGFWRSGSSGQTGHPEQKEQGDKARRVKESSVFEQCNCVQRRKKNNRWDGKRGRDPSCKVL